MENSARDADWAELENSIKSALRYSSARTESLDWAVMIFSVAFGNKFLGSDFNGDAPAEYFREQIERRFEKEDYIIPLTLKSLDDDALIECWRATVQWLKELSDAELRDFSIYLIDKLISSNIGYEIGASKASALMVRGIFNRGKDSELIDVTPSTGELFVAAQDLSYVKPYMARQKVGADALLKLKLSLHNIVYQQIGINDIARGISSTAICVLDINATSSEGIFSQAPKSEPVSTLKQFMTFGIQNRCVIITPLMRDKNFRLGEKLLKLASERLPISAVIRFSASESGKVSNALMIITDGDRSEEKYRDVLYIDISKGNTALQELNYLEASELAASIYQLWNGHLEENSSNLNVQRVLNAQFEHGYRDIPRLCGVFRWSSKTRIELHSLKEPDEFSRSKYQPSLLINSAPILDELSSSRGNQCLYVIGNNGEGKSFLLRDLIHLMVEDHRECVALTVSLADRFPSMSDGLGDRYRRMGEFSSKSRRSESTTRALLEMLGKFDRRFDVFTEAMTALGFNQNLYLVRKSNASKQDSNSKSVIPLKYFSLQHHSDPDSPHGIDPARYEVGIVPRDENHIIPFSRLSSGERNIIQLVTLLVSAASRETTFFLDEPEISLHVKWQQVLPNIFSSIAKEFKLSLVLATHSPVIIANAGFGNSICYVAHAGTLELINSKDRHSVETILLQGFQTYTPHNREVHEKCANLVSNVIGLVNTDKAQATDAGAKAIAALQSITAIIQKTGQHNGDAQARGDLDLLEKAIAAIRSVLPTTQVSG